MNVKGSAMHSLQLFITENFGEEEYINWCQTLTEKVRSVYESSIELGGWYPLKAYFSEPNRVMCDMFFDGDTNGAWACGKYSAEFGLSGIYKFFMKFRSSEFILKKTSQIIVTYYQPCAAESEITSEKSAIIRITQFPEIDAYIEARICGWIEMALQLNGCNNLKFEIPSSLVRDDPQTTILLTWE